MQTINSDLPAYLQLNQFAFQINNPNPASAGTSNITPDQLNYISEANEVPNTVSAPYDIADITTAKIAGLPFDITMNDIASYKDIISVAQNSISQMKTQGEDIKDIISQAQQGGVSQETLDKMQAEVDAKILDISIIKEAAEKNGVNTEGENSIDIKNMESLITGNYSNNGLSSYDLDLSFDIDGISFDGSAKISMGKTDDGTFQFAFDVNLNYDLSNLTSNGEGITSEDAPATIENFLNSLDNQDSILSKANKIIDSAFEKIFNAVNGMQGDYGNTINSSLLSKQLAQQSSTIFDNIMMNQMPGLAYNLI